MSSIEDPDVRKDFEDELLSKVVALQEPQVARYKEIYEKYVKKGEISEAQAKAQVQALINEAQGLLSELKSWGDKTGIPDLSKAAVDETLRTKGDAIWRQRWNETRSAVLGIVAGFDYKGAPIQVRGSLTTGWRGPHKGQVHFNVDEFDVDMYVVHPEDFQLARRRVTPKGGKIFPDVRVPDLLQVSNNVSAALGAKFPHVEGIREPNIVLREKPP